jgi:hypothetical protein
MPGQGIKWRVKRPQLLGFASHARRPQDLANPSSRKVRKSLMVHPAMML